MLEVKDAAGLMYRIPAFVDPPDLDTTWASAVPRQFKPEHTLTKAPTSFVAAAAA